jgi:hypothetical protein
MRVNTWFFADGVVVWSVPRLKSLIVVSHALCIPSCVTIQSREITDLWIRVLVPFYAPSGMIHAAASDSHAAALLDLKA